MTQTDKQILIRTRIKKLSSAVTEAIDKICAEENYDVSYTEINAALISILQSNNQYELKDTET